MSYSMGNPATFPADVAPTLAHELVAPIQRQRGWVAVPTYDLREYVKAQLLTAAAGFVVGVGIGAALGNVLKGTALARNGASRRRTSTRKRERGRPSGQVVNEGAVTVTIDGTIIEVRVDRGSVVLDGVRRGSVYDLGTSFVAVPRGGESKRFGTLAGAVKHVLRHAAA